VETDKGFISTHVVVNAAGGYSAEIGRMAGVELPVVPERHHILVTEPVEPMLEPMVMSFSLNIYCQQTPHGSFIMGRGDDDEPRDGRVTSTWSFLEEMARTCVSLMPPLGKLSVLRQWAGLYENSPDRQPIYGPVDAVQGLYLACGFSGHGFMFAPATGLIVSGQILGEKPRWPVEKLSLGRFARGELVFEPSVV
jgi:sarcosine oxidase subunit beta